MYLKISLIFKCKFSYFIINSLLIKKIIFLDDDIIIPNNFVQLALDHYEEKSYKSWWAWHLNGGNNYYKDRVRVLDKNILVNYCGPGVSIIDSSIFLEDNYFNLPIEQIKYIDDIWTSFYVGHIMKWKLSYLDINGICFF